MLERRRWRLPRAVDIQIRQQSDLVTRWDLPVRNRPLQTHKLSLVHSKIYFTSITNMEKVVSIFLSAKYPPYTLENTK